MTPHARLCRLLISKTRFPVFGRRFSTASLLPTGTIRPIIEYPNKVLSAKADPIQEPLTPEISQLLADLVTTCRARDGLGLAAPQLGMSVRAFVMRRPSPSRMTRMWRRAFAVRPTSELWICVNPRVVSVAGPGITGLESCLSVPDCSILVRRQRDISVEFTDVDGQLVALRLEGLPAVVFQHELDHLDGVLLTDREQRAFEHSSYSQELHKAEMLWHEDVMRYYRSLVA